VFCWVSYGFPGMGKYRDWSLTLYVVVKNGTYLICGICLADLRWSPPEW
jgi:hypothetical protein